MIYLSIIGYALLVLLGSTAIFYGLRLYQQYRFRFLLFYLLFLVFNFLAYFLDIISDYLILDILYIQQAEPTLIQTSRVFFLLLSLPILVISFYFLLKAFQDIFKSPISKGHWLAFFMIEFTLISGLIVILFNALYARKYSLIHVSNTALQGFILFNFVLAIPIMMMQIKRKHPFNQKNESRIYHHFFYFHLYTSILSGFIFSVYAFGILPCQLRSLFHFSIYLYPVFYMMIHLQKLYSEPSSPAVNRERLDVFFQNNEISPREREIALLVYEGYSNNTIGTRLKITLQTVKAHLYNVYKKLKIKNRWQLIQLIRSNSS